MKVFPRIKIILIAALIGILIGLSLWATYRWLYSLRMKSLAEEGASRLELYVTYLQGVLEKYESLPELLANDKMLTSLLNDPRSPEQVDALNKYLETINNISNASDTYLMDSDGLTIAASNWNEEYPFLGINFSYRPYFKEAMSGHLGRYFAMGTSSSLRGYYFAYPVRLHDKILGALVVKINIESVEKNWGHTDETFLVTDTDGVIFLTTRKDWRFRSWAPLSEEAKEHVNANRRYPNTLIQPLPVVKEKITDIGKIVWIKMPGDFNARKFLLQTHHMEHAGWNVQILMDTRRVDRFVSLVLLMICFIGVLGGLFILVVEQRRQRLADLKHFEEQAMKVLQEANTKLETRVVERTQELTETNSLLRKEIEDRKRTEIALQHTRAELIHAAKMAALGQMSAGINHELNQPLAAIRSYSDNGRLFLQKGRLEDTMWNLEQISELTERMAQIGVQLKLFSRKTSGSMTIVPLHGIIDGALEILKPVIRKSDISINVDIQPEDLGVRANHVLLQQVMVNLIGNALQAIEGCPTRKIRIASSRRQGRVAITVEDSGAGILPEHLPHIFEPFYTTKQSGQGLGLGLTITERIIKEMNGEIQVLESNAGAKFEIILEEA
ncbi:MAG: ATP-binding protein [Desulfocapsaceae bacterium]|nr:ATP-binding protein [Desulfocapsaceae bacterium]